MGGARGGEGTPSPSLIRIVCGGWAQNASDKAVMLAGTPAWPSGTSILQTSHPGPPLAQLFKGQGWREGPETPAGEKEGGFLNPNVVSQPSGSPVNTLELILGFVRRCVSLAVKWWGWSLSKPPSPLPPHTHTTHP